MQQQRKEIEKLRNREMFLRKKYRNVRRAKTPSKQENSSEKKKK